MVSSHRACGFAAGAALLPVYGWDCLSSYSVPRLADVEGIVAAGLNPAANARPGVRGNPYGFLSSRVRLRRRRCSPSGIRLGLFKSLLGATFGTCGFAAGAALLLVYGWDCLRSHSAPRLADGEGIVAA